MATGSKWLLGPPGTGVLWLSDKLRERIVLTMVGPDIMKQGVDYLNHSVDPWPDARKFEFGTLSLSLLMSLKAVIEGIFHRHSVESIYDEVLRLQNIMLEEIARLEVKCVPIMYPPDNRSGIISLMPGCDIEKLVSLLREKGVVCSARGGMLRLAPHYYLDDDEITRAVRILKEAIDTIK